MSRDALVSKLDALIDKQYRRNLNKLKGSPLCLWSRAGDDRYKLKYYHSYREDMCDTMMTVDIEKGMERCSLHGFIHKPPAIWAVFIGVIASLFIDFLIITYSLLFVQGFDLWNGLALSACVSVVRVFICLYLVELDRSKIKILREELYRVIHDRTDLPESGDAGENGEPDESEENDNA